MPTVSTKLSENDFKILKSQAEAQGDTVAAYVRKQLRPRIATPGTSKQEPQRLPGQAKNIRELSQ